MAINSVKTITRRFSRSIAVSFRTQPAVLGILLLTSVWTAGCATTDTAAPGAPGAATISEQNDAIRPVVEKLAVNVQELGVAYDNLHIVARDALTGPDPDRQLDYIQKVYLHVNAAMMVAEYQYRLLSVIHYLDDARRTDYLTLQSRAIDKSRTRMADATEYIALYDAFIKHQKAKDVIAQAVAIIQGNIYLYDQLLDTLEPWVHPAGAFTPDPYGTI
jgi:hypothetical protein